jgi:hypothetical protein
MEAHFFFELTSEPLFSRTCSEASSNPHDAAEAKVAASRPVRIDSLIVTECVFKKDGLPGG